MSDLPRITVDEAREAFKKMGLVPNTGMMLTDAYTSYA